MIVFGILLVFATSICFVNSFLQQNPEINDQFEVQKTDVQPTSTTAQTETSPDINDRIFVPDVIKPNQTEVDKKEEVNDTALQITNIETTGIMTKFYIAIRKPITEFMDEPRVNIILKNMGTCIVNGAMEIISYYLPAPLIPLIASAAGTIIPFEPVVMLRKRMPVTSYRRAFNKAVNSFMGTFDKFKTSEEDPYMTRRFNRRFMQDNSLQDKE